MTDVTDATMRAMHRRATVLAVLVVVQGLCVVFYAADSLTDLRTGGLTPHNVFEALVTMVLILGTGVTAWVMRRTMEEARRSARALSLARGALAEVMEMRFAAWALSPAEADVAMLTLKGLEVAEIAVARGSAQGTVRAQLAAVYRKSGVANRTQLATFFLDDLMDGPVR